MSRLKHFLIAFALTFSAIGVVPQALAQGTTIITIDEAKIIRNSKAGQDIRTKLAAIETQINGELQPTATSLETEGKALNEKLKAKASQQEIAADTALMNELTAYDKKATEFAQKRARVSQEFANAERQAFIDFNAALEPVLMEVVREKGAQMIMSRRAVIYSADTIDVSDLVISKLDAKTPTINVQRKPLPAQQ